MSESPHKLRGQYTWKFTGGSDAIPKSVARLEWLSTLDRADALTVTIITQGPKPVPQKELPPTVEFSCQGKILFKGHLVTVNRPSGHTIDLGYRDALFRTDRSESNALLKDQTLEDVINKIATTAGLSCRFHGAFSEMLPSLYLGGKTAFAHLAELSREFGFFFYAHAPSEVVHIYRLGAESETVTLDWSKDVASVQSYVRSDLMVSQVEHRYFDPGTQAGVTQQLEGDGIYSPINSLAGHEGVRIKRAWPFAQGNRAIRSDSKLAAAAMEATTKNRLSKEALFQETARIRVWKPTALPGQTIDLKDAADGLSGKHLVYAARLELAGALPQITLTLVRP